MNKISYALGMTLGANLKDAGVSELDYAALSKGMKDVLEGKETTFSPQEGEVLLNDFFSKLQSASFSAVKESGEHFLSENAKKTGVCVTSSGLQYEIITESTGKVPTSTDQVKVHYHGTLSDGTVFDSSVERGEPATFGVTQVIPGWVEALQLMPVGSKWKLYIPYHLAYGEHGAGKTIQPYSALIFEVELLEIV